MELVLLLLLPILIALGGYIFSVIKNDKYYQINFKEFAVLLGVVSTVVAIGYFVSRWSATYDNELWNGRIAQKQQERVSCSHSYPCNPHSCGEKGEDTCWDICYKHSYDYDWALYTSNGERLEINRVDSQGVNEPPRFAQARIGEPTAVAHRCVNYIKANPWTILKRQGVLEKFKNLIPEYPITVYDYHYADRFVDVSGKTPPAEKNLWNRELMEINAALGKKKEVNIVFVVVPAADSAYLHALEEAWLGGKKNDVVVIFGASEYPKIDWVRVMSWTRVEELKVTLRNQLQEIGTLEKRPEISKIVFVLIDQQFVRTKMAEFKYLMAGVRPPTWALVLLLMTGVGLSIGLTIFFWKEDPFGSG